MSRQLPCNVGTVRCVRYATVIGEPQHPQWVCKHVSMYSVEAFARQLFLAIVVFSCSRAFVLVNSLHQPELPGQDGPWYILWKKPEKGAANMVILDINSDARQRAKPVSRVTPRFSSERAVL